MFCLKHHFTSYPFTLLHSQRNVSVLNSRNERVSVEVNSCTSFLLVALLRLNDSCWVNTPARSEWLLATC